MGVRVSDLTVSLRTSELPKFKFKLSVKLAGRAAQNIQQFSNTVPASDRGPRRILDRLANPMPVLDVMSHWHRQGNVNECCSVHVSLHDMATCTVPNGLIHPESLACCSASMQAG